MTSKSEQLQYLFELRDKTYSEITFRLTDLIGDTVIDAIYNVVQLPPDRVAVLDIYTIEDTIVVAITAKYPTVDDIPEEINELAAYTTITDDVDSEPERMLKVVLPLTMVFDSRASIQSFIQERLVAQLQYERKMLLEYESATADHIVSQVRELLKPSQDFDWATLSEDQVNNLHQVPNKGIKH